MNDIEPRRKAAQIAEQSKPFNGAPPMTFEVIEPPAIGDAMQAYEELSKEVA